MLAAYLLDEAASLTRLRVCPSSVERDDERQGGLALDLSLSRAPFGLGNLAKAPMNAIHLRYGTGVLFILGTVALISLSACTRPSDRTVQVRFPAAPGVKEEASVRYLGVDVGKVDQISLEGAGVLLTLQLQRSDVAIHRGDRFEIVSAGLLGDHVIDIKPEPSSPLVTDPREICRAKIPRHVSFRYG